MHCCPVEDAGDIFSSPYEPLAESMEAQKSTQEQMQIMKMLHLVWILDPVILEGVCLDMWLFLAADCADGPA